MEKSSTRPIQNTNQQSDLLDDKSSVKATDTKQPISSEQVRSEEIKDDVPKVDILKMEVSQPKTSLKKATSSKCKNARLDVINKTFIRSIKRYYCEEF